MFVKSNGQAEKHGSIDKEVLQNCTRRRVAVEYGVEGLRIRMDEGEMRRAEGAGRWGRRRKEAKQASPSERALSGVDQDNHTVTFRTVASFPPLKILSSVSLEDITSTYSVTAPNGDPQSFFALSGNCQFSFGSDPPWKLAGELKLKSSSKGPDTASFSFGAKGLFSLSELINLQVSDPEFSGRYDFKGKADTKFGKRWKRRTGAVAVIFVGGVPGVLTIRVGSLHLGALAQAIFGTAYPADLLDISLEKLFMYYAWKSGYVTTPASDGTGTVGGKYLLGYHAEFHLGIQMNHIYIATGDYARAQPSVLYHKTEQQIAEYTLNFKVSHLTFRVPAASSSVPRDPLAIVDAGEMGSLAGGTDTGALHERDLVVLSGNGMESWRWIEGAETVKFQRALRTGDGRFYGSRVASRFPYASRHCGVLEQDWFVRVRKNEPLCVRGLSQSPDNSASAHTNSLSPRTLHQRSCPQVICEELVAEKKALAKAVASLNTVRRKGKANIHIMELQEDDDIDG
ncbi:hypothetical protein C8R44DRAFT_850999 [Mycena epipterygia]|nr:hypothetical protein C8R44DRAFT_850999 [Mycena epipterygia]